MKAYTYKLKSKYLKDYRALVADYGFAEYKGEDGLHILAMPFRLSRDSLLVQGLIKRIEFLYEKGTSKEREEWENNGLTFTEVLNPDQSTHFSLNLTDEIYNDITEAQVCISLCDEDRGFMFINAPDKIAYYNVKIFDDSGLSELVNVLLQNKIIYRKRVKHGDA